MYGVFKLANEGGARIYAQERGLASIGLRPHTVYGVGRDQGVTSTPTVAMLAAAAGVPYEISFGGSVQFQYAPDVAAAFVQAARTLSAGASVHNLAGEVHAIADVIRAIEQAAPETAGTITAVADALKLPEAVDAGTLASAIGPLEEVPLVDGVADTIGRFRALLAEATEGHADTGGFLSVFATKDIFVAKTPTRSLPPVAPARYNRAHGARRLCPRSPQQHRRRGCRGARWRGIDADRQPRAGG